MIRRTLTPFILGIALSFLGTSALAAISFTAYLSGSQEVPTNASIAKGFRRVTLNDAETSITVSVYYGSAAVPLTSNVIDAHIHGPAVIGVNANVIFPLAPAGGAAFGSVSNSVFNITPAQVANLRAGLFYFNIHTVTNTGREIRGQILVPRAAVDYNGDGRTDFTVARNTGGGPEGQMTWFNKINGGNPVAPFDWGIASDIFLDADFDGDGRYDPAVWRPSNATFYIIQSQTITIRLEQFGQAGDDPTVVGDYNADGKADVAVYRSGAQSTWFYRTGLNTVFTAVDWGSAGDRVAPGDYDGDGRSDFVVYRVSQGTGTFYKRLSSEGFSNEDFNFPGDPTFLKVVPGDYDGDAKTDLAVRGLTLIGNMQWHFKPSGTPGSTRIAEVWGDQSDVAVPGDYTGDGKTDYAVWRPVDGTFYIMTPVTRNISTTPFGQNGDVPVGGSNGH